MSRSPKLDFATDLRAAIRERMTALNQGLYVGAIPRLARRLAARWGISPDSADKTLRRYLRDGAPITSDALCDILDELGGRIVWAQDTRPLFDVEQPAEEIDAAP